MHLPDPIIVGESKGRLGPLAAASAAALGYNPASRVDAAPGPVSDSRRLASVLCAMTNQAAPIGYGRASRDHLHLSMLVALAGDELQDVTAIFAGLAFTLYETHAGMSSLTPIWLAMATGNLHDWHRIGTLDDPLCRRIRLVLEAAGYDLWTSSADHPLLT